MDLMTSHTWNICVFALAGIILLGFIVYLFRVVAHYGILSWIRSMAKSVAEVLQSWRTETETEELEVRIKERMQENKLIGFRRLCHGSCIFSCPFTLYAMFKIAMGLPRVITPVQDVLYFLTQGLLVVILHFPGVVSWTTIDLFYTIFSVCLAIQVAPFACNPDFMTESIILANTLVCLGSMARRNTIAIFSANVLVGVSACSAIWARRDVGSQPPMVPMAAQVLFGTGVACISYGVERGVKEMMRQRIEVESTREVLSAAIGLLRSCCDVVVELDTQGVIVSSGTELGSFLLRGTDQCMQGCCLAELMPHEDERRNFLSKLDGSERSSTGLAEVMHVQMRDGLGNALQLELLLVRFHRGCDQPHYMVGLREFGDLAVCHRQQHRQASSAGFREFDAMSQQHHPPATLATFTAQDVDALGSEESPSVPDSLESTSIDSHEEPSAVAVLDCSQPGFPIRSFSPGFGMRIGRVELNSSMTDMVKQKDNFVVWLETALIAQAHNLEVPPDCRVVLKLPQGRLKARCRLLPSEAGGGYERVQLLLYGLAGRHERRERREGAGQQEGGSLRGTPVSRMAL